MTGPERRRRWSADEKLAMVRESFEPGKSVSMVARQHGVNPNQLFHWRKLRDAPPHLRAADPGSVRSVNLSGRGQPWTRSVHCTRDCQGSSRGYRSTLRRNRDCVFGVIAARRRYGKRALTDRDCDPTDPHRRRPIGDGTVGGVAQADNWPHLPVCVSRVSPGSFASGPLHQVRSLYLSVFRAQRSGGQCPRPPKRACIATTAHEF